MYRNIVAGLLLITGGVAVADPPAAPAPPQVAQSGAPPDASSVCPQSTGTRIKRQPGDCLSSPGRTYGSEELRSTGEANTADALRRMDPSLTTTH